MSDILQLPLVGFRVWHITQIYMGEGSPEGTVVPTVGDAVIDWDRGIYQVKHVINQIPTLELFDPTKSLFGDTQPNLISGLSNRNPSVIYRAFIDNSVTPKVIVIDDQYRIYGSDPSYCKLFKGTDTNPQTGIVVSRNLSGSSENVTLETISNDGITIKRPNTIYSNVSLEDGDTVTLVEYSSSGVVTGGVTLVVKNSAAIRSLEQETVYIVDIELITPLLSETQPDVIEVPFGQPLQANGFQYRLLYSNGTTFTDDVDGVKCKLLGLDNYNTNWAGDGESIVLQYTADVNEPIININSGTSRTISKTYTMINVDVDPDLAFKLYVIPRYQPLTQDYVLNTWLVNAAHDFWVDVTGDANIYLEGTTNAPDLGATGVWQQLDLVMDIEQVLPHLVGYTFTQTTGLRLNTVNGNLDNKPWLIDYANNQTLAYGNFNAMKATAWLTGNQQIDMSCGATTQQGWLDRLYYPLKPSYDVTLIGSVPTPTHFALRWYDEVALQYVETNEIDIDSWNIPIERLLYSGGSWQNMSTVEVVWYYTLPGDVSSRLIGVSPVMVQLYQGV